MSDGEYITDGFLIDLAEDDWREDILPFELILVHQSLLPDLDPQVPDKQRPFLGATPDLVGESLWSELDLKGLLESVSAFRR